MSIGWGDGIEGVGFGWQTVNMLVSYKERVAFMFASKKVSLTMYKDFGSESMCVTQGGGM